MSNPVWNTGVVMTLGVAAGCVALIAVEAVNLSAHAHEGYNHHNGIHAVAVETPKAEAPKTEAKADAKAEAPKAAAFDLEKAKAVLPKAADCMACHMPEADGVGPSVKKIVAKMANDDAKITAAAANIIKGVMGTPSTYGLPTPAMMTPHPTLTQAEAELLVRYMIATGKITP